VKLFAVIKDPVIPDIAIVVFQNHISVFVLNIT
jgi:hypothetical protein